MNLSIEGSIYKIGEVEPISDNFRKRELIIKVVEENGDRTFENYPKIDFTQDKCEDLDNVSVGENVEVSCNVRGNKYNDKKTGEEKFFTSLSGWRIEVKGRDESNDASAGMPTKDDIPF